MMTRQQKTEYQKKWYKRNREKVIAKAREHYALNREAKRVYQSKRWHDKPVAVLVVYVVAWMIGEFIQGYSGTTMRESKPIDELWKDRK